MKYLSVIVLIITIIHCGHAQEIDEINKLFETFNNLNSPGAAVVVVKNGKVIHSNGYGNANLEYEIPITSQTIFHIASVSKQFTAFAILLLEDQGLLSQEDYIGKYLPDLPSFKDRIQIRHLLHHTSGLREMEKLQQIAGITTADQIESTYIYNLYKNQNELNFPPGDELEYNNTGYFLLARIVERVTGESFSDWTKENIFTSLGMLNSQFYDDCSEIVNNRAYAYGDWDGELYKGILNYSYVGPTSILTTGEDMSKWLLNFSKIQVGNEEIIRQMLNAPDTLNSGDPIDYGNGLGVTSYKGIKVVLHSGHDANYRAGMFYFPEHQVGIALLGNYYSISPFEYGFAIADIILKDLLREEREEENDSESIDEIDEFTLPTIKLSEFQGDYVSDELGLLYKLIIRNDTLTASFWRNEEVLLTPISADSFDGNQNWFKQIKFIRNDSNSITGFRLSAGNVRNLIFKRITTY